MGRPPLPKGQQKAVQLGVRFNPKDGRILDNAANQSGLTKVDFVRNATNEMAQRNRWGKTKFSRAELNGQLIEFELHSPNGITAGIGHIDACENPNGKISVDIIIDYPLDADSKIAGYKVWIDGSGVERIEMNPKPNGPKFRLLA